MIQAQTIEIRATTRQSGKHWPRSVRELARVLYASGRAGSLRELAEKTGVPHDTLRRWCRQERWGGLAAESDIKATQEAADWLALQRQEHWKNAVSRACILFEHFDAFIDHTESIRPSELRLLVDVLEKADAILRRNLPHP